MNATVSQSALREKIQSVLQYSSWEGQDILRGEPQPLNITLLFDRDNRPIVLTDDLWRRVIRGTADIVVAARIDEKTLITITPDTALGYLPLEDISDDVDLEPILRLAVAFMKVRTRSGGPYYGAIGASRHWGSDDTFRVYKHQHKFSKIKDQVEKWWAGSVSCGVEPSSVHIFFPSGLGTYITNDDLRLIQSWSGDTEIAHDAVFDRDTQDLVLEHQKSRIFASARIAEKFCLSIYTAVNGAAEDCSILQLNGNDERWKAFDIFCEKPIDVKNVNVYRNNIRQSFVSKFKRHETAEVTIAAIATRTSRSMRGRGRYSHRIQQIFLGELDKSELLRAKRAVESSFERTPFSQIQIQDRYLPAWAFELPLTDIDYDALLSAYDLFGAHPESVLSAAIAAASPERAPAYSRLNPAQKTLVDSFVSAIAASSYSKKTIALFTIAGFSDELICGRPGKSFVLFMMRLLALEPISGPRSHNFRLAQPEFSGSDVGGLYDPLGAMVSLFTALSDAADHIQAKGLQFDAFHAPSPSVLLGRLRDGPRITIYTHCGGRSEQGRPCDSFPLVVGKNATCPGCGKLVCHDCSYCSAHCSASASDRI